MIAFILLCIVLNIFYLHLADTYIPFYRDSHGDRKKKRIILLLCIPIGLIIGQIAQGLIFLTNLLKIYLLS